MKETTVGQYAFFVEQCKVWIEYWGLKDWNVDYVHAPAVLDDGSQPLSHVTTSGVDKYCIVSFNTYCPESILDDKELMSAAFHEMAELLLMDFWLLAVQRFDMSEDQLTEAGHAIIARLSNAVFEDYYEHYTLGGEPEETEPLDEVMDVLPPPFPLNLEDIKLY